MNGVAHIPVTLCLQNQISSGYVDVPDDERLSDLLNGVCVKRPESRGKFLALSDVTVFQGDGEEERLPSAYVNKASIQMAATWDTNSGRGIGAQPGSKPYPYVNKMSVPVKLKLAGYTLDGNIHCAKDERAEHVLEENQTFLPLTDVTVHPMAEGMWSNIPFVAVNREQILSLQEEDTPLLKVERAGNAG